MINAYAALASGGHLFKPQIVEKYIHADGSEEKVEPEEIRQVVSAETSRTVGKMLRAVVTNGHGKRADVAGYSVVGKTGTAQVATNTGKGYVEGQSIGSFVGYAPLEDPRFVVLVKLNNPKNVDWAESSAAPTFAEIMKFLLSYAKIKPTEITKTGTDQLMGMHKRKILERCLRFMTRAVLRKYHPLIIGITGSVGKSSAKEAIALVLAPTFRIRSTEGNYNNEIGIPLTILGARSGGGAWP
jgi:UDP-N-acetylmuramyl pentapeptide synthase